MKTRLWALMCLSLLLSGPSFAQTIVGPISPSGFQNYGGVTISNPQYHLIFMGAYPSATQSALTQFVKYIASSPDPVILQYDSGALGAYSSSINVATASTMDVGPASTVVQNTYGPTGLLNSILSKIFGRQGGGNDIYVIFVAPGTTFTCNGYAAGSLHTWLTFRKGLVIAVNYYTDFSYMTELLSLEIDDTLTDPLDNCWHEDAQGQNLGSGMYEIAELCEWLPKTRGSYVVNQVYSLAAGTCQ